MVFFKPSAKIKKVGCNTSLTLDDPTRWNSTYTMLEVVEKHKKAFELMPGEYGYFLNYLFDEL